MARFAMNLTETEIKAMATGACKIIDMMDIDRSENPDTLTTIATKAAYDNNTHHIPGGKVTAGYREFINEPKTFEYAIELEEDAALEIINILVEIMTLLVPYIINVKAFYLKLKSATQLVPRILDGITSKFREKYIPQPHYAVTEITNNDLGVRDIVIIVDDGMGNNLRVHRAYHTGERYIHYLEARVRTMSDIGRNALVWRNSLKAAENEFEREIDQFHASKNAK